MSNVTVLDNDVSDSEHIEWTICSLSLCRLSIDICPTEEKAARRWRAKSHGMTSSFKMAAIFDIMAVKDIWKLFIVKGGNSHHYLHLLSDLPASLFLFLCLSFLESLVFILEAEIKYKIETIGKVGKENAMAGIYVSAKFSKFCFPLIIPYGTQAIVLHKVTFG